MAEPQNLVPNLSEMMEEYTAMDEEVHLEPQKETTSVEEPEAQLEVGHPTNEERKRKRPISVETEENEEQKEERAFLSD